MECVDENTGEQKVRVYEHPRVSADGLRMPTEQKWSKSKETLKSGVKTHPSLGAMT